MRKFASLVFIFLSYAFFLMFSHVANWLFQGSAGHFSVWQQQVADWLLAGP